MKNHFITQQHMTGILAIVCSILWLLIMKEISGMLFLLPIGLYLTFTRKTIIPEED